MPNRMSKCLPDRMTDRMRERMSDRLSEYMPNRMQDRMSEYMQDKMSEYMSDRMSWWGSHEVKYFFHPPKFWLVKPAFGRVISPLYQDLFSPCASPRESSSTRRCSSVHSSRGNHVENSACHWISFRETVMENMATGGSSTWIWWDIVGYIWGTESKTKLKREQGKRFCSTNKWIG